MKWRNCTIFFQKNLKKTPGALYRTKPHDMDEGVFIAISSRSRKMALSLTNISDSVLHLQEEIINREKKDIWKRDIIWLNPVPIRCIRWFADFIF